jgi:hypothetical protein
MYDDNDNNVVEMRRGTQREWAMARIVLIGGFAIAIGVAAWFALRPAPVETVPPVASLPPPAHLKIPGNPSSQERADSNAAMMVCAQELMNAKNNGSVPAYGQLSSLLPKATAVRGRYTCQVATSAEKYTISADLICRTLTDSRCVALYDVTTADGTVLYQRQQ